MNNDPHVKEHLFAFLTQNLDPETHAKVDTHLRECESCRREYASLTSAWESLGRLPEETPGARVRLNFYDTLTSHVRQPSFLPGPAPSARIVTFWKDLRPWKRRIFQGAILALTLIAGVYIGNRIIPLTPAEDSSTDANVHSQGMKRVLALTLLRQPTASDRLTGVALGNSIGSNDEQIVAALIDALKNDPNVNVRLSALDALSRVRDQSKLRDEIIAELGKQTSPLLQAAYIEELARIGDKKSIEELRRLLNDETLHPAILQRVRKALDELHS
jgi:hypothetical protein